MSLRAYFDTNIWISYIQGPEAPDFDLVERVMNGVKKRRYTAIVSYFVLTEVLNVLRRIVGNKFDILKNLTFDEQCKYTCDVSTKKYQEFVKNLLELHELVEFVEEPNIDADLEIFRPSIELLKKYFGTVKMFNRCDYCKSQKREKFFSVYSGLGPADFIHILLALQMECHYFVTLDKGFKALIREPMFSPIQIMILEREH